MKVDAWMLGQPGIHVGVFVGAVVIDDDVQVAAWVGAGDLLQKVEELFVAGPHREPRCPGRKNKQIDSPVRDM